MTNKSVNVIHKRVDGLGSLSITDFLPNNTQTDNNNIPKLDATQNACGQMESIIMRSIKELINNAEEKFLV